MPNEKKPIDEVREKLEKGYEKLSQDEVSCLVDQYMIDSFEASMECLTCGHSRSLHQALHCTVLIGGNSKNKCDCKVFARKN